MNILRIEHHDSKLGMWSTNVEGLPALEHLSDPRLASMEMPFSENYKKDSKDWVTAVRSREELLGWFTKKDIAELIALGFRVLELEVSEASLEDNQVLFPTDARIQEIDITNEFTVQPVEA